MTIPWWILVIIMLFFIAGLLGGINESDRNQNDDSLDPKP